MGDIGVICSYCHRTTSDLRRCGRCYNVYYCSKMCQTMDWPQHKSSCVRKCRIQNTKNKAKLKVKQTTYRRTKIDNIVKNEKVHVHKNQTSENTGEATDIGKKEMHRVFDAKDVEHLSLVCDEKDTPDQTSIDTTTVTKVEAECKFRSKEFNSELNGNRTTNTVMKNNRHKYDNKCPEKQPMKSSISSTDETVGKTERNKFHNRPATEKTSELNLCTFCSVLWCFQKCSGCKEAFYCSRRCQRQDWSTHKTRCKQKLAEEEEKRISATLKKRQDMIAQFEKYVEGKKDQTVCNFTGSGDRMNINLTPEQALLRAPRPIGSLGNAVKNAKMFFPFHDIITDFDDIPSEKMFSFFPFMAHARGKNVLVALMYRYHEHVMRHGVYLKDAKNKESKVEFYLDHVGDNPFPFFSYSQVKPAGYICLVDPVMHLFFDGTVGIRINNPDEVKVLDIEMVLK